MMDYSMFNLCEFLRDYPAMAIRPSSGNGITLKGRLAFNANHLNHEDITDSYNLTISVPLTFPQSLPTVIETGGRIPRCGEYHVNADGTLCLGSPIRLLWLISKKPSLSGFAERCLVPFLYAVSKKLRHGGHFLFDELAHGTPGKLNDYIDLFQVKGRDQVLSVLKMLGMKKRQANKLSCPCGCGLNLGKCKFNTRLVEFRRLAPRPWFKAENERVMHDCLILDRNGTNLTKHLLRVTP